MVYVNWLLCQCLECIKTGLFCVCISKCEPIQTNKHSRSFELMHYKKTIVTLPLLYLFSFFAVHNKCKANLLETCMELCAMRLHAPNYTSHHHNYYSITIAYQYILFYCANASDNDTFIESISSILQSPIVFDFSLRLDRLYHVHCFCHFCHFKCIALHYVEYFWHLKIQTHTFIRSIRRILRQISCINHFLHYVLMFILSSRKMKTEIKILSHKDAFCVNCLYECSSQRPITQWLHRWKQLELNNKKMCLQCMCCPA